MTQRNQFIDLLPIEGNPFYGDIMERSVYYAQSPDGRQLRYFTD